MASKDAAFWLVTVGGGPCPVCGLDGDVAFVPDHWARLKGWLVNGRAPRARLVCVNGHEWPAGSTAFLTAVGGRGWWRWPLTAIRVLVRHRTAEPIPLFWVVSAVVGVVVGVVAEVTLGWFWWLVTAVWLVLAWLMVLATAFRYPGRADLWIDLVATVSPQRAQQLETKRLLQLVEGAPGPVYGLAEWEGPRQIGGHGRSSSAGLTRLELVYGSPLDGPHLKVNTIWKRQAPDLAIENSRNRLIRDLWHRQVRSPDELDGDQRRSWLRSQHIDIDQRPTPDWTPTSISIEGTTHQAEVYREDDDWVVVVEAEPVLIEVESHQVPMDHLALAPVPDLTVYTDGRSDQHRSSR